MSSRSAHAAIVLALTIAGTARAEVIMFDNTDRAFVWTGRGSVGINGSLFDPTRAPHEQQSATFTPIQLAYIAGIGGGSFSVQQDGITAGASIRIARAASNVIVEGPGVGQQTVFRPAETFQPAQVVGQGSLYDLAIVDTGYFNISLGRHNFLGDHAFIGFRIILPDGLPRYGWIEVEYREGPFVIGPPPLSTDLMYQPLRWAYETEPNTPITVPSAPGAALLLGAAAATAGSRRRRDA